MDHETDLTTDLATAGRKHRKQRRNEDRKGGVSDGLDPVEASTDLGCSLSRNHGCGRGGRGDGNIGCGSGGGRGGGGCGGCDGPCDLMLLRLSTMLLVAAMLVPERPVGWRLVRALVRGYQRWLTRFTPPCPSTPSCPAFALAAVDTLGARRGLAAAAERIRRCGSDGESG